MISFLYAGGSLREERSPTMKLMGSLRGAVGLCRPCLACRQRCLRTLAALASLAVFACAAPEPARRIVLITLDTTRADALNPALDGRVPLAHTAAWASQGLRFDRCYSASSTTQPTHASLFTGLNPWEHRVPRNGAVLAPEFETLAEALSAAGYFTSAVVASFPVHPQFGFDQGFDRYVSDFTAGAVKVWSGVQPDEGPGPFWSPARVVAERAHKALDDAPSGRQFFWFHFFDPHGPYGDSAGNAPGLGLVEVRNRIRRGEAVEPLIREARRLYEQDLQTLDAELASLFRRFEAEEALGTETHVVLVADHGESFGEGGSLGHGKRLTREQIQVPCILRSARAPAGRSDRPVGSIDIYATLLDLAGAEQTGHGHSLLASSVSAALVVGMRRTFSKPHQDLRTDGSVVVVDGLQFYLADDSGVFTGNADTVLRFDRSDDVPNAKAERLKERFADFAAVLNAATPHEKLDRDTRRQLKALGYVDADEATAASP